MAHTVSVICDRIKTAASHADVAAKAGVNPAVWASATAPRLFRGFGQFVAGKSRGRLPFIEYDVVSQPYIHENKEGGTMVSNIRLVVHSGGRDLEVVSNQLTDILLAVIVKIRDENTDNYFAFGDDAVGQVEQSPWGHSIAAELEAEHTYDRSTYELS